MRKHVYFRVCMIECISVVIHHWCRFLSISNGNYCLFLFLKPITDTIKNNENYSHINHFCMYENDHHYIVFNFIIIFFNKKAYNVFMDAYKRWRTANHAFLLLINSSSDQILKSGVWNTYFWIAPGISLSPISSVNIDELLRRSHAVLNECARELMISSGIVDCDFCCSKIATSRVGRRLHVLLKLFQPQWNHMIAHTSHKQCFKMKQNIPYNSKVCWKKTIMIMNGSKKLHVYTYHKGKR